MWPRGVFLCGLVTARLSRTSDAASGGAQPRHSELRRCDCEVAHVGGTSIRVGRPPCSAAGRSGDAALRRDACLNGSTRTSPKSAYAQARKPVPRAIGSGSTEKFDSPEEERVREHRFGTIALVAMVALAS